MPHQLIVLGATGSVGRTTAEVVKALAGRVQVRGLVAQKSFERLWQMGLDLHADWVGLTDERAAVRLKAMVNGSPGPEIVQGLGAIVDAMQGSPRAQVMGAMSGFAGLVPTLAAVDAGMDVLLANKETLVAAGQLVVERAQRSGSRIIPVDSEHSAIFQCLAGGQAFQRIILTCSGGPFRGRTSQALTSVAPADALSHPTWDMGAKITIDSATLMNKGLEVIEAHWLFQAPYPQISVVIHPESIIHSMVEFEDGATLAQMGYPDMRIPIEVALAWPQRWPLSVRPLNLAGTTLSFEAPDETTFPALKLAREVGEAGGLWPCVLNAANEVAVHAFLQERIAFLQIVPTIRAVLDRWRENSSEVSLESIQACDDWARTVAMERISA